jgi:hypothetical protein
MLWPATRSAGVAQRSARRAPTDEVDLLARELLRDCVRKHTGPFRRRARRGHTRHEDGAAERLERLADPAPVRDLDRRDRRADGDRVEAEEAMTKHDGILRAAVCGTVRSGVCVYRESKAYICAGCGPAPPQARTCDPLRLATGRRWTWRRREATTGCSEVSPRAAGPRRRASCEIANCGAYPRMTRDGKVGVERIVEEKEAPSHPQLACWGGPAARGRRSGARSVQASQEGMVRGSSLATDGSALVGAADEG